MNEIIEHTISEEEIEKYREIYEESKSAGGEKETQAKFDYAIALLKSRELENVREGITMLETLFQHGDHSARRGYLYFVSIGHIRLFQYKQALDCVETLLRHEPDNHQAKHLRDEIKRRLRKDGLIGMAVAGGAVAVIGGIISLGISLSKK